MRLIPALLLLAAASPAVAQDPSEDWDLTANAERHLTLATLDFGDNVLALRCQAGTLDLLLTGVPISIGATRAATVSAGSIMDETQTWTALPGQPVVGAAEPARLARQLRAGGPLDVRLAPEDAADRPRRYQLTAPRSERAVNTVLTACGEPLDEPRDLIARLSPVNAPSWAALPLPAFPDNPIARNAGRGRVTLSCVIDTDWGLTDCRVEAENPTGAGFGDSALRSARDARLTPTTDGVDGRGRLIHFTMRFEPAAD